MSNFKDMTRNLLAAGSLPSASGKSTDFFYEENNSLCVRTWTGSELAGLSWVATNVKSGTSAPCIVARDIRIVFCIDQSNSLKCYVEPPRKQAEADDDSEEEEDDELWKEMPLGQAKNVKVHPASHLEASGFTVIYQAPDGHLNALVNKGKDSEVVVLQAADPLPGTPLASFVSDETVRLFYVNKDNSLHYLTKDAQQDKWTDAQLASAKFDKPVSRITIAQGDANSGFAAYGLTDGKLVMVKESSEKVEVLGTVQDGEFRASTGQESVIVGWRWRPVPIFMDFIPYYWSPY